ncbi:general transcription factor II H, polypeptide 2 [Ochromonadaceae sp. CCMP2298]|nr:general transcription factor II H, polypeptide 2 [Ochromonadaceae sp. CCMP2298]
MFEDDAQSTYRWEQGVSKSWDTVQEDEAGNLITISTDRERSHRAKQNRVTKSIRRGLIRYMVLAIDSSKSAAENDYKPCRLEVSKACTKNFIAEYFDQNPISQIGLILTRDRSAQRLSEMSGNPKNHIHQLQSVRNMDGLPSLQNTLLLAMSMLRHIPNYGHRELLIVFSSLSTCDPGDIFKTIREAKALKVRVSVICLVAEVFICKQMAELTGGLFTVATDASHLQELLQVQKQVSLVTDFIYMGFPKRTFDSQVAYGFEGKRFKLSSSAYLCPRCGTRATDIPTSCCVCGLQLNSSSHIARSHHHLFPVPNFIEYDVKVVMVDPSHGQQAVCVDPAQAALILQVSEGTEGAEGEGEERGLEAETLLGSRCRGCLKGVCEEGKMIMRCPRCWHFFCVECDLFMHDSLHNCPGCPSV